MPRRSWCLGLAVLLASACGGSDATPTQPSRTPATLSPASTSVAVQQTPGTTQYVVTVSVRETGGQTSAILRDVRLQAMRGADVMVEATVVDAWPTNRIAPNATATTRTITLSDVRTDRPLADRVTVTVTHVGDATVGSLIYSAPVPGPAS